MKKFEGGVKYFTNATANIPFPEDDFTCWRCALLNDRNPRRCICNLTGEILIYPEFEMGGHCPLRFDKEDEANE